MATVKVNTERFDSHPAAFLVAWIWNPWERQKMVCFFPTSFERLLRWKNTRQQSLATVAELLKSLLSIAALFIHLLASLCCAFRRLFPVYKLLKMVFFKYVYILSYYLRSIKSTCEFCLNVATWLTNRSSFSPSGRFELCEKYYSRSVQIIWHCCRCL